MLIVAEIVHHEGSGPTMYWLASKVDEISRLYHPFYITSVAANPEIWVSRQVLMHG